jgi:hypothetical protein
MSESQSKPVRLNTVGKLASDLGCSTHQIRWVLATRPHIRPVALAGCARLFDDTAKAQLRYELNRIAARRGK